MYSRLYIYIRDMFLIFLIAVIVLYMWFDINYVIRTYFTVLYGRVFQRNYSLDEDSTLYGIGTFSDCNLWFRNIREARLIRELDFARYLFYDRTGIYHRSRRLKIRSLQGCTLTLCQQPIPLFTSYKIVTKLVYWDDRSLFFEHRVITLEDGVVRYFFISRQYAIGENGDSSYALLEGLPGFIETPKCPENIQRWLECMNISSKKIK